MRIEVQKAISLLLSLLIIIGTVTAAVPVKAMAYNTPTDGNGEYRHYLESSNVANNHDGIDPGGHRGINIHSINYYPAYCIDYTRQDPPEGGLMYTAGTMETITVGNEQQSQIIMGILEYLDCGTLGSNPTAGLSSNHKARLAAQMLIYEIQCGMLTWNGSQLVRNASGAFTYATTMHTTWAENYGISGIYSSAVDYNGTLNVLLRERLNNHEVNLGTVSLAYDPNSKTYSGQATDSTGYLNYFTDAEISALNKNNGNGAYVTFTKSGNILNIAASKAGVDTYFTKNGKTGSMQTTGISSGTRRTTNVSVGHTPASYFTIYYSGNYQRLVTMKPSDYEKESTASLASITLTAPIIDPTGTVTVHKTSDDGIISNMTFTLTNQSDTSKRYTMKTDASGAAVFEEIPYGTYTLEEQTSGKYKKLSTTVTVSENTPDISFSAHNSVIYGDVVITKRSTKQDSIEDGDASFAGIKYSIIAMSAVTVKGKGSFTAGQTIMTITTDENGIAKTSGAILPYGSYKVVEKDTGNSGYALDSDWSYSFTVTSGDDGDTDGKVSYSVIQKDDPLTGGIEISKTDSVTDTAEPSGDGSLEGATFDIINRSESSVLVNGKVYAAGVVVMTVTTGSDGKAETGNVLPYGTYEVKETGASAGYLINSESQTVKVHSTDNIQVTVKETAITGGISVSKIDSMTGESTAQGDASLKGAEFEIINKSSNPVTVKGKSYSIDEVVMKITTNDSGIAETGNILPYGTYEVMETQASEGYTVNVDSQTVQIREGKEYGVTVEETVLQGEIEIIKYDSETESSVSAGNAVLSGAEFAVINRSENPVVVDGTEYKPGDTVATLVTDDKGHAATEKNLPYGTYGILEIKASEGYNLNRTEYTINATAETGTVSWQAETKIPETPIRNNLIFKKIDGETLEGLGSVVFRITLLDEEGGEIESHIAVTDEKGWFDSNNLLAYGRLADVNANDAAVNEEGIIDSSKLNPDAPVWFKGVTEGTETAASDRNRGAFPYGVYRIEELQCEGITAEGSSTGRSYVIINPFDLEMHHPERVSPETGDYVPYDYDIVISNTEPPVIRTVLADAEGNKELLPERGIKLIDKVSIEGLEAGKKYVLTGKLVNKADGTDALDDEGRTIEASVEISSVKETESTELVYSFNAENADGNEYVSVVTLTKIFETGGETVAAAHEDLTDADQTVVFVMPDISTTATAEDGGKTVEGGKKAKIVDEVKYEKLVPGREYVITGKLVDKETGEYLKDVEDQIIAESVTFKPEKPSGSVKVIFEIDATGLRDKVLVAYENLYYDGRLLASHEDIDSEAQTITISMHSMIKTDASTAEVLQGATVRIIDKTDSCIFEGESDEKGRIWFALIPGHAYTYQELEAPEGYSLDSSIYSFEVDENGKPDQELVIKNKPEGAVVLTKTNAISGASVEGATVEIYLSTDTEYKTPVFTQITDRFGRIYFNPAEFLSDSTVTFKFKETKAPSEYYINEDVFAFSISPDGTVSGTTEFDDVPVGTVAIKKTDANGAVLPGAKLSVYSENGTLVGQATTGSTGRIYFTPEKSGRYYFIEDEAPKGYIRDTEKHYFSIDEKGVITNENGKQEPVVLVNRKEPSGSTGDSSNIPLAALVASISFSMAGAGTIYLMRRKRRQNNS